jgi:hypothetical protein
LLLLDDSYLYGQPTESNQYASIAAVSSSAREVCLLFIIIVVKICDFNHFISDFSLIIQLLRKLHNSKVLIMMASILQRRQTTTTTLITLKFLLKNQLPMVKQRFHNLNKVVVGVVVQFKKYKVTNKNKFCVFIFFALKCFVCSTN